MNSLKRLPVPASAGMSRVGRINLKVGSRFVRVSIWERSTDIVAACQIQNVVWFETGESLISALTALANRCWVLTPTEPIRHESDEKCRCGHSRKCHDRKPDGSTPGNELDACTAYKCICGVFEAA